MAYRLDSFHSQSLVPEMIVMEVNSMKMSLSGGDLNSGVTGVDVSSFHPRDAIVLTALRDTLYAGFESGFEDREDSCPFDPNLRDVTCALIQLAIMTTIASNRKK